jgi:hypothetical protein
VSIWWHALEEAAAEVVAELAAAPMQSVGTTTRCDNNTDEK